MKKTIISPALLAFSLMLPVAAQAAITTVNVTGWDQDIIVNNGGGTYDTTVTGTLDGGANNAQGYTFAEQGSYPLQPDNTATAVSGVNSGVYTSATGSGATFQFQAFTGSNALLLGGGISGTLSLVSGSSYDTLALYGTTSGGPTTASVTLTFSDLSTSVYTIGSGSGITADWFNNGSNTAAAVVGDRVSNRSEDSYSNLYIQADPRISIYESLLTLTPEDQAKTLTSVSIQNTGGGNLAVMAISGEAVPEASTALLSLIGVAGLLRRRRA